MNTETLKGFLSDTARKATRNEIRELLKVIAQPGVISLAGGLPSPETFPLKEFAELLPDAIERDGARALQYGPTEGDPGFRTTLIETLRELEQEPFEWLTPKHVLVTSASQQSLDICSRIFLNRGDTVLCELPSYLGALGAFTACGARMVGIPLDREGLRTDILEQRLTELRDEGTQPKFLYTVPDFQNPSGVTMSLRRRNDLLSLAHRFNFLILEDSPYRQLRFTGCPEPSLAALDRTDRVISMFTFSKLLFPGLRLGWIVANPAIINSLTVAKQPIDLCTSGLSQLAVREYLASQNLNAQVELSRRLYSQKCRTMLDALQRFMRPEWKVHWTQPEGGMFVWLTLPEDMDGLALLGEALKRRVAFVGGKAFHCDGSGLNTLRLNFSYPSLAEIELAVERLAECIGVMAAKNVTEPATQMETGG